MAPAQRAQLADAQARVQRRRPGRPFLRCPTCLGSRELRVVDVYAARRMGPPKLGRPQAPLRLDSTLAVAWWGHLWTSAGVLALDLPRVELEPDCPNRRRVEAVLQGLVRLQAIFAQDGPFMPCEYSEGFVAASCDGVSEPGAWRSLKTLAEGGYVSRGKVKPEKGRARWRYQLTGKGLVIERPAHKVVLSDPPTLEAVA